ncbi:type II secretion system F family protein [Patescibacteria group bacterium]|nr:type II secretion system F family protein [Patescibacteria group bacterium]
MPTETTTQSEEMQKISLSETKSVVDSEPVTNSESAEPVESKEVGQTPKPQPEASPRDEGAGPQPKQQYEPQLEDAPPEEVKEVVKKKITKRKKGLIERLREIGTISQKEVVEFTRHLSVMLSAGVTIFEAISFLRDQSKNKVFSGRLSDVLYSLNNGQSLSASMRKFPKVFPEIYTNIIHVGEQSGTLPETMINMADHLEENDKFKSKVKGALVYPKIILGVMGAFLLVLFLFVMPRILTVFQSLNAELPTTTKITIGLTNFIQNNILMIFLVIVGSIVGMSIIFRNPAAKKVRDHFYLKVPFIGKIVLNYNTTQVAQHFGTLFASGLTIIKCLEITRSVVKNKMFQDELDYMVDKIKNGASFSQSFKEKSIFPPMFNKLIRVGERTGKLPHVVEYMKNYYKGLVDSDVKNITTIIEPVIMVLLGLMVAGLVVTVIGPIYQLISNVGQ